MASNRSKRPRLGLGLPIGLSRQKRSWQIWSGLYNITVEILRALTIKLTRAGARGMARARALARTRDRPRLRHATRVTRERQLASPYMAKLEINPVHRLL